MGTDGARSNGSLDGGGEMAGNVERCSGEEVAVRAGEDVVLQPAYANGYDGVV